MTTAIFETIFFCYGCFYKWGSAEYERAGRWLRAPSAAGLSAVHVLVKQTEDWESKGHVKQESAVGEKSGYIHPSRQAQCIAHRNINLSLAVLTLFCMHADIFRTT